LSFSNFFTVLFDGQVVDKATASGATKLWDAIIAGAGHLMSKHRVIEIDGDAISDAHSFTPLRMLVLTDGLGEQ
jgi:hypothetical protein